MRDVLSKIGEGMEQPEAAWEALNGHGGTRAFLVITWLFAFSLVAFIDASRARFLQPDVTTHVKDNEWQAVDDGEELKSIEDL